MTPRPRAGTGVLRLYHLLTRLLAPVAYRKVASKLQAQGVDNTRIAETRGQASLPPAEGPLIWFHAASVGESLSVLTLIARMGARHPELEFLITSGTATSADLLSRRMPPRCRHQFAPLDTPRAVAAFYDHWRPTAGIFVESELWPNILLTGKARGTRLILLNARLSQKSVQGWRRWPDTARAVLGCFDLLIAQNAQAAENLRDMGAPSDRIRRGSNLKATSAPLPVDQAALADLQSALGPRPLWIASSTHPGEEETVLAAHAKLRAVWPDLCLILIPRHPDRGDEIARLIDAAGLTCTRHATGALPAAGHPVYLADTLGEVGTFYALCGIVFLGGSLRPIGGHNPFEPAQAGAAILTGPYRASFEETYAALLQAGAAREVSNATTLAEAVTEWLQNPGALDTARQAAKTFAGRQDQLLDQVLDQLDAVLDPAHA